MEFENLLNPISTTELERRWSAVRAGMEARNIDVLIAQNSTDHLGGYVRWLVDLPATNGSPFTVIVPRNAPMVLVRQGGKGVEEVFGPHEEVHRGLEKVMFSPSHCSVHYTGRYDAELVLGEIKRRGARTVGVVNTGCMYFDFYDRLKEGLGGVATLVDATEWVDALKAVKSAEEIALIRRTAAMQDEVMTRVLHKVRPGMRDFEVTALAQYEGHLLESEHGTFNGHSAPQGRRSSLMLHRHEQGRTIRAGDYFNLLIENNGPGGFYTEVSRTLVFGKASPEVRDAFDHCLEAQKRTVQHLRVGTPCRDLLKVHNEFMMSKGRPEERRLYAHGQGYDLVERPLLRDDETMSIAPGMNFAVHPAISTPTLFMMVCDNFLVNLAGKIEPLHATPAKLFEL
jgi:Xaa-Pro aminopeptidase